MKGLILPIVISLIISGSTACSEPQKRADETGTQPKQKVVKKTRDDGSLSSVSQVDEKGFIHGIRVNYYNDGQTVHSKVTYNHGIKEGPAIWYYRDGKVFEHTSFADGKRDGLTRKYHKNGQLLSECEYKTGNPLPGLVEYNEDGSKVTDYPEVRIRKIDKLAFENRVILEISSDIKTDKVKYYFQLEFDNGQRSRSYFRSDNGFATLEYRVAPGDVLIKNIEFFAELPTTMGNTQVKKVTYQLAAKNMG
jgi:antitoxin component YwqK of YwqJK toxin-antitoxin module